MPLPFAGIDTARVLLEAMKTAETNHRILANNIANVDTPHFNASEMDFQKTLQNAIHGRGTFDLRTARPRHMDFVSHRPRFDKKSYLSKNDFNKVDLDDQLTKMAANRGNYTTYARLLGKRFQQVKDMLQALR